MSGQEELARWFAHSLDERDYGAAAGALSPECVYTIEGEIHRGPEAIMASYRDNAEWAAGTLDGIRYESSVRRENDGVAIEFVDHIRHAGRELTHRCVQRLEFDDSGLICRITHHDLPGEREAVERFFAEVGLARD